MVRIWFTIKLKKSGIFYETKSINFNLIVIRINKYNELGKSRPCYNCLNMLQDIGIKKVYYTNGNNNELICEYVKNMVSIESSSSTIHYDTIKQNLNKDLYFEQLLKKYIPSQIKYKNLLYFIEYNYKDVCPNCKYTIIKSKLVHQIIFYNKQNQIIIYSNII